jgi:hypothetical protein
VLASILCFAAAIDKDRTDSVGEIGEEDDLYWRMLLRGGQACLRLVNWLADALVNGVHEIRQLVRDSPIKKTVKPEKNKKFLLQSVAKKSSGIPFLSVGSWADATVQGPWVSKVYKQYCARTSACSADGAPLQGYDRGIILASSSPAAAAKRQAPMAARETA